MPFTPASFCDGEISGGATVDGNAGRDPCGASAMSFEVVESATVVDPEQPDNASAIAANATTTVGRRRGCMTSTVDERPTR